MTPPLRGLRAAVVDAMGDARRISPTAHYTGYVWARNGLGDPGLVTPEGRLLHGTGQLVLGPVGLLGGPTLEHFLLARHRIIDLLLAGHVSAGRVGQVVELAAGMSPRGLRFTREYPGLTYLEVDLPGMAERKRAALRRIGSDAERLRVESADVFGPELDELFAGLDPERGVAVVTEGLLNYFPTEAVVSLWTRIASASARFPEGVYLSDLHLRPREGGGVDRAFAALLGTVVRGSVHFHFDDTTAAAAALEEAGFDSAVLHAPREYAGRLPGMTAAGAGRVRVVEARTLTPGLDT
jgi:O-methyltransferase involved in polyketide biosynthesis